MSEVEIPQKRKVGRPKTVKVDKKEYQKEYYQKHRETLLEGKKEYYVEHKDEIKEYQKEYQKEYIENLKESKPEKFQEIRTKQKELSSDLHRKERAIYKLIKELYSSGLLSVPDTHKEIIAELIN